MREKGYFKRFLGFQNSYVVKNDNIFKNIFNFQKFKISTNPETQEIAIKK